MSAFALAHQIEDFWNWFEVNQTVIEAVIRDNSHPALERIIENLDQHILGMGKLKWQLDEPTPKGFTLVISPNSNRDLFKITKQIMAACPTSTQWQFFDSIPPTGELVVSLYNADMDVCTVDTRSWEMILEPDEDGRDYVQILAENMDQLDEDTRLIAVDLALTNILGEALKINHLSGFNLVDELEINQHGKACTMETLAEVLVG